MKNCEGITCTKSSIHCNVPWTYEEIQMQRWSCWSWKRWSLVDIKTVWSSALDFPNVNGSICQSETSCLVTPLLPLMSLVQALKKLAVSCMEPFAPISYKNISSFCRFSLQTVTNTKFGTLNVFFLIQHDATILISCSFECETEKLHI